MCQYFRTIPGIASIPATKDTVWVVTKIVRNHISCKALINGEVRYIRVSTRALKKGFVTKAPKRTWKKPEPAKA